MVGADVDEGGGEGWGGGWGDGEVEVTSELRNVNSLTRSKNLKLNFTPRKARKSRQFWYLSQTKLTKRIDFENKC